MFDEMAKKGLIQPSMPDRSKLIPISYSSDSKPDEDDDDDEP